MRPFPAMLGALALACATPGCRPARYWEAAPAFPAGAQRWSIPLDDPLVARGAVITAEFQGALPADGGVPPLKRVRLTVDSGAFTSMLPAATLRAVGAKIEGTSQLRVKDAAGNTREWRGGSVPVVRLGALELRGVVFGVGRHSNLIGRNILDARPWEIDLDRGLLVLGAPVHGGPAVATLGLTRRDDDHHLHVRIDGHEVLMRFDTGAMTTTLSDERGREIGVERVPLKRKKSVWTVHGRRTIDELLIGRLELAGVDCGRVLMISMPEDARLTLNEKVAGLFGYDALAHFRFRVEPGEHVQLRRRGDLLETTRDRVERWDWVPRCPDVPGCVAVEARSLAPTLKLVLRASADYPGGAELLLACVDAKGQVDHDVDFLEVHRWAIRAGDATAITVGPGSLGEAADWLARVDERCARFALVDVNAGPQDDRRAAGDYRVKLRRSLLATRVE